jgi:BMFP domain-containing protein YqiC
MLLDKLITQLSSEFKTPLDDSQLRTLANDIISCLDLVSREEFDAQTEVLARTRDRLECLESELAVLEKQACSKEEQ